MTGDYIARLAAQGRDQAARREQQVERIAYVLHHDVGRTDRFGCRTLALYGGDAERRGAQHQPIVASVADADDARSAEAPHIGGLGTVFAAPLEDFERATD